MKTLKQGTDAVALKRLEDLEELIDVPEARGGVDLSDWERSFIQSVRVQYDERGAFSQAQREKITEIWHAVDLRKRPDPEPKVANLFSNLTPKEQARQRERAAKVRLPWEK